MAEHDLEILNWELCEAWLADAERELRVCVEFFDKATDNLEEIFENREQIEIAKYYEHIPKPTLIAIHEFLNGQIYFRNPNKEALSK